MRSAYFIEPLDVLFLRGNKLFGDPGSFGESLIPPWPSAAAGAFRSALLVHKGLDPARFAGGEIDDPELGTPDRPGPFTVTAFHLARRNTDGAVEVLYALPADLVANADVDGETAVRSLRPHPSPKGLRSSAATGLLPVLAERERSKPVSALWLNADGWAAYIHGRPIDAAKHLMRARDLWQIDTRVGVGLNPAERRAQDGHLFTVQAAALRKQEHGSPYDVGFLAEVAGAVLPEALTLRFGGDGRGALAQRVRQLVAPEPDYDAICRDRRCRLVVTSPGLFAVPLPPGRSGPDLIGGGEAHTLHSGLNGRETPEPAGWLPTGTTPAGDRDFRFELHGVRARLVSAAVPRAEIVSGWDLAKGQPKPAQHAAPIGSVYWLDDLEATPEALRKLVEYGLWHEPCEDAHRRAEGFNRLALAAWNRT